MVQWETCPSFTAVRNSVVQYNTRRRLKGLDCLPRYLSIVSDNGLRNYGGGPDTAVGYYA